MKEKIGIEKLIELLNEYETFKVGAKPRSILDGELLCDCLPPCEQTMYGVLICAKPYQFIEWLVENDKIDLLQLDNRIALSEFNKVERVLMALSISDTPIEDLISYLR